MTHIRQTINALIPSRMPDRKLVTKNKRLREALKDLLADIDTGGDRTSAACHSGITTVEECCQCRHIFKARKVLEEPDDV